MIQRPCLACGHVNGAPSDSCASCGLALSAWCDPVVVTAPQRAIRRLPGRRIVLLLGLVLTLIAGFGPRAWTSLRSPDAPTAGPTWRDPPSIAAWAHAELKAAGAEPSSVDALIERRTAVRRRVLMTAHPMGRPLADVVRAVARLLVRGRDRGEATSTHVAIIRQGKLILLLPVGEAAALAGSDASAIEWIERNESWAAGGLEREHAGVGADGGVGTDGMLTPELASATSVPAPDGESAADAAGGEPGPAAPAGGDASPGATTTTDAAGTVATPLGAPVPAAATGAPAPPGTAAAPQPIRLLRNTGGPRQPARVAPGEVGVVLLRAQLHPGTARSLRLDSISVRARGTLADAEDVAFVELTRDVDRDGTRGPGDVDAGGRQRFTENDGTLTFDGLGLIFGETATPLDLIFTMDLADDSSGGAISLAVQDPTSVSVVDVATMKPCGVRGAPLTGSVVRVDIKAETAPDADEVQAELDRLQGIIDAGGSGAEAEEHAQDEPQPDATGPAGRKRR